MHLDPALILVVGISLCVLMVGFVLDYLRQPLVVAYLLAGVLLGPGVLGFVPDASIASPLGAMGLVLLLFFVGMEIKPIELAKSWRVAIFGTLLQILGSLGAAWILGELFDWPLARVVLVGFVISLSSTAVVVKVLQDRGELNTPLGQDMLGILLVQDLAVVPMLIVLGLFSGDSPGLGGIALQVLGAGIIVGAVVWVMRHPGFHLPFAARLKEDPELQVFGALSICLGCAFITGALGLSSVLGAFVAGIVIAAARETEWFEDTLQPFHVLLVAFFFLSVGLMLDVNFLIGHWVEIVAMVAAVFATNTFINAAVLRALGVGWRQSFYGGGILSQAGEFSFVLAAIGLAGGIVTEDGYQLVVATIALSLVLSPPWAALVRRLSGWQSVPVAAAQE